MPNRDRSAQLAAAGALLEHWQPLDDEQERLRERYLGELAARGAGGLTKAAGPVHLTASLVLLDESLDHVLLTLHRKARMWLQFGGHIETEDADLAAAALREGREESGLAGLDACGAPVPVELNAHELGAGFAVCREHLDVRFALAVPHAEPVVSEESVDVRWFPIDALPSGVGADVPLLIARARSALGAQR